ncbi:hypothetical protein ACFQX6_58620 [Streptosporangium lutulentum]
MVLAASLSILVLLGLASVCAVDGVVGRAPSYTMLAVGVVILPTAAQVTYVELGGLGGPGLSGLWRLSRSRGSRVFSRPSWWAAWATV